MDTESILSGDERIAATLVYSTKSRLSFMRHMQGCFTLAFVRLKDIPSLLHRQKVLDSKCKAKHLPADS